MRTSPAPRPERRLPSMRVLGPLLWVIWCSSDGAFPWLFRCARRPTAAPIGPDRGPATRRSPRAAQLEGCRPDAGPLPEPRPSLLREVLADDVTPPAGQSAAAPPTPPPSPARERAFRASCVDSGPLAPSEQP